MQVQFENCGNNLELNKLFKYYYYQDHKTET